MIFCAFIRKYPDSFLAEQWTRFEGKGFDKGQHGDFAELLYKGEVMVAIAYADMDNQRLLRDLLFPQIRL
jgi:hypothetical protein